MVTQANIGRRLVQLGVLVPLMTATSPSRAESCAAPCLDYAISMELAGDWFFAATPADNQGSDIEPTIDAEFSFRPAEPLKLVSFITTEPVLDRSPGDDRAFADIGTYVQQLYAEFDVDQARFRWGKLEPEFGLATHVLDGIYATDLVGEYDNEERWGVESSFSFKAFGLSNSLTASAFTTDRTVLSESLFTNRGRTRLSDGGAGNAEGIASLAAMLDGCKGSDVSDCYADGKFGYRLGVRHQKAGQATAEQIEEEIAPRDETGILAAATARFDFDNLTLRALGELAYFRHFDGEPGDAWIGTVSASLETDAMTYMAAYSRKKHSLDGEPEITGHLFDFTVAYDLGEDASIAGEQWMLAGAYGYARNAEDENAHVFGVTLTADFNSED